MPTCMINLTMPWIYTNEMLLGEDYLTLPLQFELGFAMEACDIFIRSYWKDFAWLELCLAAIAQYCHGFRSVIVVVPRSSQPWLRRFPALEDKVQVEFCRDYRDDYLGQQATKLRADTFTDADFICHVDSDCIFCRPTAPADLIEEGKSR